MPVYRFECQDCQHRFEKFCFKFLQGKNPSCPQCHSHKTSLQIAPVNTPSSEKGDSPKTGCLPRFGFG